MHAATSSKRWYGGDTGTWATNATTGHWQHFTDVDIVSANISRIKVSKLCGPPLRRSALPFPFYSTKNCFDVVLRHLAHEQIPQLPWHHKPIKRCYDAIIHIRSPANTVLLMPSNTGFPCESLSPVMHNSYLFKKVLIEAWSAFWRGALHDQLNRFLEFKTSKRCSKIVMNSGLPCVPLNCRFKL